MGIKRGKADRPHPGTRILWLSVWEGSAYAFISPSLSQAELLASASAAEALANRRHQSPGAALMVSVAALRQEKEGPTDRWSAGPLVDGSLVISRQHSAAKRPETSDGNQAGPFGMCFERRLPEYITAAASAAQPIPLDEACRTSANGSTARFPVPAGGSLLVIWIWSKLIMVLSPSPRSAG